MSIKTVQYYPPSVRSESKSLVALWNVREMRKSLSHPEGKKKYDLDVRVRLDLTAENSDGNPTKPFTISKPLNMSNDVS